MRKGRLSVAGASILFALGLAAWEVYFFWYAGSFPELEGRVGLFTAGRLGFNMAWLAALYLTYQLISIPFSLPSAGNRFIGVVDGMASLVPLAVVLIVVFGKPQLVGTPQRWEAALPAHLHHHRRPVRRVHIQSRAQPPHHGCRRRRIAGADMPPRVGAAISHMKTAASR